MMWGAKRPAELTRVTIEEAQESLLAIGHSPRTINHQLGPVIFALRCAHERDLMRGTFAMEVFKSSGDLRSLQAMLGHANLSVTSVYLSEADEHKRSAVRGLRFGV
jgi:hypothetical protein